MKRASVTSEGTYKDVRALARGMRLLEALSELGWTKPGPLSAYAGIDRATVYRIVNTLEQLGYLVRREEDGSVALTSKVAQLADGIRDDELTAQVVAPVLRELTDSVLWPSDFAAFTGGAVTIQASTHKMSPVSIHRRVVGKHRPLMRSALGRAILAAMEPKELEATLAIVSRLGGEDARDVADRRAVNRTLKAVRANGYAASHGEIEARISAIALPVKLKRGVVGAVNIIFFRSAMTTAEAAERYLKPLSDCVRRVEETIGGARRT